MAQRDRSEVYFFDDFRLDTERGTLFGSDGAERRLRPKALALLRHVLNNPGRLLEREQLLDALWPGTMVTDDSLTQCMGDLRQALGNRAPHVLRTIPKRGYMLITTVRLEKPVFSTSSSDVNPKPTPPVSPVRNIAALRSETIAVHRFDAQDGNRGCVLLAKGVATDLIAALTSLEGLRVSPAADIISGVDYQIRGEVRAVGGNFRVTVLIDDAVTGTALWAERFEQTMDGPPELSASQLTALVVHIGQQVDRHSLEVARQKPIAALSARELHLIGREHHKRCTEADTQIAKDMFNLAIEADPEYAHAYAWQAYTVHRATTHGWGSPGGQVALKNALRLARRAVQIDLTSPLCLSRLAFTLMLHRQWDDAVVTARAALTSDRPAFTAARNTSCEVLTHAGYAEESAVIARGTLALDPLCPPTTRALLGRALLLAGNVEDALPALRWCASQLPDYAPTYDSLVVAAFESGRTLEALSARRELFRLQPAWTPHNYTGLWYFRRKADLERFQTAHRRLSELADATNAQHAFPPSEAPASGENRDTVTAETLVSQPLDLQSLAGLRREPLVVFPLQTESDSAAIRVAATITADLMAELIRYEDLRIIAGPDSRVVKGFALRGELYAAGDQLYARVRLDDLATGAALWAKRMEWASCQSIGLSGESITALATAIDLQIERESLRRARQKPEEELSCRDVTLLGREHYNRGTEAETMVARGMFVRARVIDPEFAVAHAWNAFAVARAVVHGWASPGRLETAEQAVQLARRAVELEPDSPLCLASLALPLALLDHWEEAVASARLALRSLRTAGDGTRVAAGDVLVSASHPTEAAEALREVIAFDPHCSPLVHLVLGRALLLIGRSEEAINELRLCTARLPDYALGYRTIVVAAVEAGLIHEAREALRNVVRLRPGWVDGTEPIFWFLRRPEDLKRWQDAWRVATRLDVATTVERPMVAPRSRL